MKDITTIDVDGQTFSVHTLDPYTTPYYFVPQFGSVNHFRTLAALKGYIRRQLRKQLRKERPHVP